MDCWRETKLPEFTGDIKNLLEIFNIEYSIEQVKKIEDYVKLLDKWNKTYNLTAVRDVNEMIERHIADSLSIAGFLQGKCFIDVGTGPGLPGIPLAIIFPEKQFVLLDSNGKKTRFLQEAKRQLKLTNVEIVNERVENYNPQKRFDGILSRAFSSLDDMVMKTRHLCCENGHFFAMKGQYPEVELQAIRKPYKVHPLYWAGHLSDRHLVIISQTRG